MLHGDNYLAGCFKLLAYLSSHKNSTVSNTAFVVSLVTHINFNSCINCNFSEIIHLFVQSMALCFHLVTFFALWKILTEEAFIWREDSTAFNALFSNSNSTGIVVSSTTWNLSRQKPWKPNHSVITRSRIHMRHSGAMLNTQVESATKKDAPQQRRAYNDKLQTTAKYRQWTRKLDMKKSVIQNGPGCLVCFSEKRWEKQINKVLQIQENIKTHNIDK